MKIKNLLPLIGIALFVYIIVSTGPTKIMSSFQELNKLHLFYYLLLAILIFVPITLLQTLKWYLILKKQNITLPFLYLIKLQIISTYYSSITPGKLGSFIKVSYIQNKTKKPFGEAFSSVLADRILDLITLCILSLIGSLLLVEYSSQILFKILIPIIILCFIIFFFIGKKRSSFILLFVYKFLIPHKLKSKAKESFNLFYDTLPRIKHLTLPFLLTILVWVLIYTQTYIIALSFDIKIPYYYFIPIFAISTVVTLIPVTIAGLGTRELTLITLFKLFLIKPEKVVSMSLFWVIISTLILAIPGIYLTFKNEIHTKQTD